MISSSETPIVSSAIISNKVRDSDFFSPGIKTVGKFFLQHLWHPYHTLNASVAQDELTLADIILTVPTKPPVLRRHRRYPPAW